MSNETNKISIQKVPFLPIHGMYFEAQYVVSLTACG